MNFMTSVQKEFLELYEPIHASFARFCQARVYGLMEAEDLISETVLKALENFHKVKNKKAFLSFMFTIAKNIVNDKHRKTKFTGVYEEHTALSIPDEGVNPELRYDVEVLYTMLAKLPEKQKEALILFEISGFSIQEIAHIQDAKESAVKQRLKRGREKLADLFKSDLLKEEPLSNRSSILMSLFL